MADVRDYVNNCTSMLREDISDEECELLSGVFELQQLGVGEVLLREGEIDEAFSIIVEGDLAVTRDTGGGDTVTLHHLKPGDIAGEMGFIDGTSHSATLHAVKPTHVITLRRHDLEGMLDAHPRLVYKVMRMIIRSVHGTVMRMNRQFVEMSNYITKEHGRY